MALKIGINGFGRIGQNLLRAALSRRDIDVVALNHKSRRLAVDDNFAKTLAHVLKYDSIHSSLNMDVDADGDTMIVNGKEIKVLAFSDPGALPWEELGVELVVESTGRFNKPEDAEAHLKAGAKKVVLSAPAKGEALTVVMGVNHTSYNPQIHHVVSNASCTTNCLSPLVKVLNDKFGIVKGLMTTVHAQTNDQQILDMPHRDLRRGRSGALSIIPTTTGAARAVGLVLPELKGKLNGFSMRVPTLYVSVVDLTLELATGVTVDEINAAFKDASEGQLNGILGYSELPLVSGDYKGDPRSATVDALSTMVIGGNMVKVVAWYDNEWGYANRVLDLITYMSEQGL